MHIKDILVSIKCRITNKLVDDEGRKVIDNETLDASFYNFDLIRGLTACVHCQCAITKWSI